MHRLARLITITPIVAGSYAALSNEEVLWVINVLIWAGLDAIEDSWLEIDQDCSGDISRVVALVVEDIFAVAALCGEVLEVSVLADPVLLAQLLPELTPD